MWRHLAQGEWKLKPQFYSQGVALKLKMSLLPTKYDLLISTVKFWEKFGEILEKNWWSFAKHLVKNLEKTSMKFWEQFSEILRSIWWNIEKILAKFGEKMDEVLSKI